MGSEQPDLGPRMILSQNSLGLHTQCGPHASWKFGHPESNTTKMRSLLGRLREL